MKQKSDWKRITLLRKTSFKKEIKILAANTGKPEVIGSRISTDKRACVYQLNSLCLVSARTCARHWPEMAPR